MMVMRERMLSLMAASFFVGVACAVVAMRRKKKKRYDWRPEEEPLVVSSPPVPKSRIDLLVHNVSHSDVVISFGDSEMEAATDVFDDGAKLLALPRFSKFASTCGEVYKAATETVVYARAGRRELNKREYPVLRYEEESNLVKLYNCDESKTAAGLQIDAKKKWSAQRLRSDLKVRRAEVKKLLSEDDEASVPRRAYFPLLAVCAKAWLSEVCEPESKRVVLLVTGTGTPRDFEEGDANSTENAGKLMRSFLRGLYGDSIEVVLLHSESNVFRYDENISFVRHELLPMVASIRRRIVEASSDWAPRFQVAVTSCDGAPARVATIQRSLRAFKPVGVHVWQPKTFWQYRVLSKDDVEVLPFDVTETLPPVPIDVAHGDIKRVIFETQKLADKFKTAKEFPNDMATFWHRKSRQIVVAVLLVRKNNKDKFYHGTNMEVSMPTGSLCAERNAIGSALADDLGLMRQHLKIISVLSLNLPTASTTTTDDETRKREGAFRRSTSRQHIILKSYPKITKNDPRTPSSTVYRADQLDMNPLRPCGACAEWLKKIASVNPDFSVITFTDATCQGFFLESAVLY